MNTILFYWSKGADMRVKIIKIIADCERQHDPCYINIISQKLGVSSVAIKKHVDLLIQEKYLSILNPMGKPHYLILTKEGLKILKEFGEK